MKGTKIRVVSTRKVGGVKYEYYGVQIPHAVLAKSRMNPGDEVTCTVTKAGSIVVKRVAKP